MEGWARVKKAAKYADVSERTMRSWMKDGLRYSRLSSGMIRIRYSAIDDFLEALDTGRQPMLNIDEMYKTHELCMAIDRSLETGESVSLPLK